MNLHTTLKNFGIEETDKKLILSNINQTSPGILENRMLNDDIKSIIKNLF